MNNNIADYSKTVQSFLSRGLPKDYEKYLATNFSAEGIILWAFDEAPDARGDTPGRMPQHHYIPTSVMNAMLQDLTFATDAVEAELTDHSDGTTVRMAGGAKDLVSKYGLNGVEWSVANKNSAHAILQRIRLLGVHMPTTNQMAGNQVPCSYTFASAVQVKDYWTAPVSATHSTLVANGAARRPGGLWNGTRLGFVLLKVPTIADVNVSYFQLHPVVMSEEIRTQTGPLKSGDIYGYYPIGTVLDGTAFKDTNNRVSCHNSHDAPNRIKEAGQANLYLALKF